MFEGIIDYKITIRPNLHCDWLNKKLKGVEFTQRYYYSRGRYKIVIDSPVPATQIYDGDSTVYLFDSEMKLMETQDATLADKHILGHQLSPEDQQAVLGYNCEVLRLTTSKSGEEYYYFHPILSIDPIYCQNHKLTNWDFLTTKTSSLPLRHIVKSRYKIIELTATNIEYQSLKDDTFFIQVF